MAPLLTPRPRTLPGRNALVHIWLFSRLAGLALSVWRKLRNSTATGPLTGVSLWTESGVGARTEIFRPAPHQSPSRLSAQTTSIDIATVPLRKSLVPLPTTTPGRPNQPLSLLDPQTWPSTRASCRPRPTPKSPTRSLNWTSMACSLPSLTVSAAGPSF